MLSILAYYNNLHLKIISCAIEEVATSAYAVTLQILTDCHRGKEHKDSMKASHWYRVPRSGIADLLSIITIPSIAFKLGTVP